MKPNWNLVLVMGAAMLALAACSDDQPAATASARPNNNGVCLRTEDIDHTEILTDSAIIFYMKTGKPYVNTMHFPCPSLKMEDGFGYVTDFPEVCSNAQTIRVLRSGTFCELGQFTPFDASKLQAPGAPTKS